MTNKPSGDRQHASGVLGESFLKLWCYPKNWYKDAATSFTIYSRSSGSMCGCSSSERAAGQAKDVRAWVNRRPVQFAPKNTATNS
jgi:hypothetical protein